MATVCGFVERIKYRNEENGYTVLSLTDEGEEYTLVGNFHYISEGEMVEATGPMTEHPVYGEQMTVETYEIKAPEDTAAMERYLGSGAVKGIGAALAARIVRRFKADTFRIMEEEPERLSEVKGISEKMAMAISEQVEEKKEMRQAMMFLQEYGISMSLAVKIYQEYGPRLYTVIKENPYQLADDIAGVGFKMADEIAKRVGIFTDSDFRIKSGVLYTLLQATGNGHTYLPETDLLSQASELLRVETESIEKHLMDMQIDKRLVIRESEGVRVVYASQYYYMEMGVARMLHDLNIRGREPEEKIRKKLLQIQKEESIELDEKQVQAVVEAVNSGLLIITGGPGTGKTTTINTIIRYFESEEMEILLAAPTGRAAKRMTEATGYEARTIHRLLEISGMPGDERSIGMHFERNEENPLDADAVIIDETSMVDIHLMQSLLKAVNPGTRLILVGDVNQLPSVGPGNVLKDVIEAGCFNVVMLTRIFRQASQSDIVVTGDGPPLPGIGAPAGRNGIHRKTPDGHADRQASGDPGVGGRPCCLCLPVLLHGDGRGADAPRFKYQGTGAGREDQKEAASDSEGRVDRAGRKTGAGCGGGSKQRPSYHHGRTRNWKDDDDQHHYPVF